MRHSIPYGLPITGSGLYMIKKCCLSYMSLKAYFVFLIITVLSNSSLNATRIVLYFLLSFYPLIGVGSTSNS